MDILNTLKKKSPGTQQPRYYLTKKTGLPSRMEGKPAKGADAMSLKKIYHELRKIST